MMFKEIRKCLDEFEEACRKDGNWSNLTEEEKSSIADTIDYFDMHLAEAIMKDSGHNGDKGEKIAKIILATLGMLNDIKVKVE